MGIIAWFKRLLGIKPRITIDDLIDRPPPRRPRSAMTATALLERVRTLQGGKAEWPDIWEALNPDGEAESQRLLAEVRGPHLLAPHLGLNVIEEGCRQALARDPNADRIDALQAALQSGNRFTRH
ncbi:hypothetical protein AYO40_06895 [Planctomycetaceae bacterium SCGC AG-212-D15]|nr:hypothetical protein AYO40_06895 [Planctomycetaceae bacterium SCGC AG-212-D15]